MSEFWPKLWVKKVENVHWVNSCAHGSQALSHLICTQVFLSSLPFYRWEKLKLAEVTQQRNGRARIGMKVSWVRKSCSKHYNLLPFLWPRCFAAWAVSFKCEAEDIWCGTARAVSANIYTGALLRIWDTLTPCKKHVSPTQLKFPKQAGQSWISQMLYCLMFFQSVLDPIAHDYSQVQNCMHKQLQQQFTDCELNQPIVNTISCSLLIWKELGRWLPLQLAGCGQLGLLVQFCTLKHGMCKSGACPGTLYFGPQTPNLMSTLQSLCVAMRACLLDQYGGCNPRKGEDAMMEIRGHGVPHYLKKQIFPYFGGRGKERDET